MDCTVAVGLDGAVRNLPIADNQLQDNTEFARIWGELDTKPLEGGGMLTAKTSESGRVTAMCFSASCAGDAVCSRELREDYVGSRVEARLEPGRSLTVEKLISVACFRDEMCIRDSIKAMNGEEAASETIIPMQLVERSSVKKFEMYTEVT